MGMVINGLWTNDDQTIEEGAYRRRASVYADEPTPSVAAALRSEPGRFHLIASLSCPWSQRTMIVRQLKGLTDAVPLHIAHGPRVEGYAANGGAPWTVLGSDRTIFHLHELYTQGDPTYTGRSTVPVLWDSAAGRIVSNESVAILRAFDAAGAEQGALDFTLHPDHLAAEIDAINASLYDGLNNGVYRAGFAERQGAYDEAVGQVFATLDELEDRLSQRRYLLGAIITEADWRLFPTLVRFDSMYYVLHKCCQRRLVDYPQLWAYARDLYAWRGVAATVDFDAMRAASYANDTAGNPHGIVAVLPDADWRLPHERAAHGPALVALRDGATQAVVPATLTALSDG